MLNVVSSVLSGLADFAELRTIHCGDNGIILLWWSDHNPLNSRELPLWSYREMTAQQDFLPFRLTVTHPLGRLRKNAKSRARLAELGAASRTLKPSRTQEKRRAPILPAMSPRNPRATQNCARSQWRHPNESPTKATKQFQTRWRHDGLLHGMDAIGATTHLNFLNKDISRLEEENDCCFWDDTQQISKKIPQDSRIFRDYVASFKLSEV